MFLCLKDTYKYASLGFFLYLVFLVLTIKYYKIHGDYVMIEFFLNIMQSNMLSYSYMNCL